jgi:DNA-nicking Smr family endonuclease
MKVAGELTAERSSTFVSKMPTLDLHGFHIHEAWKKIANFINECYYGNYTHCRVICGQGAIKDEIEEWLRLNTKVREFTLERTLGSYKVILIKRKNT